MNNSSSKKQLLVATGNKGKLKEIREILTEVEVLGLADLPFSIEIEEDGTTFYENAYKKASVLADKMHVPVLADDSGLIVDALDGNPGVYSARYAGEDATDADNIKKLLCDMKNVPENERSARFTCVMCLVMPDGEKYYTESETEGKILTEICGTGGFGYDPVFYSTNYNKSFGELLPEEKNAISHRAKALEKMSKILNEVL